MKQLFYLTLLSFCLTFATSCKKNSEAPAPATNNNNGTTNIATALNKKWSTSAPTARIATDPTASDYASFEFNASGNYYIIKADKSLLAGTFTVNTADSIVTLFNGSSTTSQYGTLKISSISATQLIFKLTLNATPTPIDISTTAVASSVGSSSSNSANTTAKLAKAWKMDSLRQGSITTALPSTMYAHFVLTEGGTYWTETYNGPGTTVSIVSGQWKWSDNTNTKICGSSTDVVPDCSGDQSTISFTAAGNLIMSSTPAGQTTKTYYFSILTQ